MQTNLNHIATSCTALNLRQQGAKTVNSILLDMAMQGTISLTPQQLSTLQSIAAECPYTEGTAVYDARVLVAPYDSTDYENICETEFNIENNNGRMMMQNTKQDSDDVSEERIEIYPNPANELLNIFVKTNKETIVQTEIYTIAGQLVLQHKGSEKFSQVSVKDLPNGLYNVKIRTNNIVFNRKLIINK